MRTTRLFALLLLVVASIHVSPVAAAQECRGSDRPNEHEWNANTCQANVEVGYGGGGTEPRFDTTPVSSSDTPQDRYQRREMCNDWFVLLEGTAPITRQWPGEIPACTEAYETPELDCPAASTVIPPLWVSRALDDGGYGPWTQITGYECGTSPLPAAIASAWRAMTITPTSYTTEPATGWAIASMGVIPVASAEPQTSAVTVLGTPVLLRATPTRFTWTTSDGAELTTSDTSRGYDAGGEPLTFDRHEHRSALTLATTWTGHYSLDGGSTWAEAPGTATTTSDSTSIHIFNPRVQLVDCDTSGDCATGTGPARAAPTLTDPDADGIENHLIPDHAIDAYLDARADGRSWTSSERSAASE
ncbi:hypothetical protein [Demequina muriae]|uniref:PKD domain-containing protein n=1 Tax=Demequina muriae TaxID=3051664 RepID=A0ABT8GEP7_9MICO|nr:hypothetical protein [Demequina sp. EGI L300058]MDN4479736.1 hypothetical protein [Demequina sp. EGI L300058]